MAFLDRPTTQQRLLDELRHPPDRSWWVGLSEREFYQTAREEWMGRMIYSTAKAYGFTRPHMVDEGAVDLVLPSTREARMEALERDDEGGEW